MGVLRDVCPSAHDENREATATPAERSEIQASGVLRAESVAPLTRHHANGTTRSGHTGPLPDATAKRPSVAMAVGSGAMPKTSAAANDRPASFAMSGCRIRAQRMRTRPTTPDVVRRALK